MQNKYNNVYEVANKYRTKYHFYQSYISHGILKRIFVTSNQTFIMESYKNDSGGRKKTN